MQTRYNSRPFVSRRLRAAVGTTLLAIATLGAGVAVGNADAAERRPDVVIYLYEDGVPVEVSGYTDVNGHIYDPLDTLIGEVGADSNIYAESEPTEIIGYVDGTQGPGQ